MVDYTKAEPSGDWEGIRNHVDEISNDNPTSANITIITQTLQMMLSYARYLEDRIDELESDR